MFGRKKNIRQPHIDDALPTVNEMYAAATTSTPRRWTKVHQFLHDNHGVRYFVMALAIIIASGLVLWAFVASTPQQTVSDTIVVPKPKPKPAPKFYSPLTGLETSEDATKRPVTAIMIENSTDARPQSGLKDAGIIYEAIAEGGITRFLALYQESRPGLIGPVRSVRPYYVEWASAYDPAVAHVGGSYRARQMIQSGNYGVDMDQFFNAGAYWRTADRAAPHNMYTNFDKLDALRTTKGKTSSTFTAFQRQDGKKSDAPTASSIDIGVSTGSYAVHYNYDSTTNTYPRSHNGIPHTDREGGQLAPAVVIAIKVSEYTALEGTDGNREQITTTGSGTAYVFQNGIVTEATWSRDGEKSPLILKDAGGKEIVLNRGQTWITALASGRNVQWQ